VLRGAFPSVAIGGEGRVLGVSLTVPAQPAANLLNQVATNGPEELMKSTQAALANAGANVPGAEGDLLHEMLPEEPAKLSEEEQKLLDLVNQARANIETPPPPLKASTRLTELARAHAAHMAKKKQLADKLDGKDNTQRVRQAGYRFVKDRLGITMLAEQDFTTEQAFGVWSQEDASKAVLLDIYEEAGIGIAKDSDGKVYYYMVYAIPESPAELQAPLLQEALRNALKDEEIRALAIPALAVVNPKVKDADLQQLAYQNLDVGISEVTPQTKRAIPPLTELLKSKSEKVRYAAAVALLRIDPDLQKTVPAIGQVLQQKAAGKLYGTLLKRMKIPPELTAVGFFRDLGPSEAVEAYAGYTDIPKGYWVYVYPYWYIWQDRKEENP
jgi:uncharacterized protein YkwD